MALIQIKPYRQWLNDYLNDLGIVRKSSKRKTKPVVEEEKKKYVPCSIIEDLDYLTSLDPRNWKEQDHYAVLGLKHVRYNAADEDIKRAYRKCVLKHHPDKRGGEKVDPECDYFGSIVKAYEILGDPIKRRSYDSVDKYFDDSVPEVNKQTKKNFFTEFGAVFQRNARWSNNRPVPELGDANSDRETVEEFYDFWYNFDSWREFSYLDEEDKEKGEDRYERKWIEKQNKVERQKRKKEENARIRSLVDSAYACDPRIPKFKAEDKERKNAKKKAAEDAKKAKLAEEERIRKEAEERERLKREEEERILNEKKEQEKKAKASLKKLIRQEKKQLQQLLDSVNYFTADEKQKLNYMELFFKLVDSNDLEALRELRKALNNTDDLDEQRRLFLKQIEPQSNGDENAKKESLDRLKDKLKEESNSLARWSEGDVVLLAKAFSLYPAGAQNRWESIADYLKQHSTNYVPRKSKEILAKVHELQKVDPSLKTFLGKQTGPKLFLPVENVIGNEKLTNGHTVVLTNGHSNGDEPASVTTTATSDWTAEEQKILEQALKSIPQTTPERWDRIAEFYNKHEHVPNRTKKECMKRYKELVDLIKSKKKNAENSKN